MVQQLHGMGVIVLGNQWAKAAKPHHVWTIYSKKCASCFSLQDLHYQLLQVHKILLTIWFGRHHPDWGRCMMINLFSKILSHTCTYNVYIILEPLWKIMCTFSYDRIYMLAELCQCILSPPHSNHAGVRSWNNGTVEPLYNTIVFHQNTHKRHPIARP